MLVHWVDIHVGGGGVQGLGQTKQGDPLFQLHLVSVFVTNTKSSRKSLEQM